MIASDYSEETRIILRKLKQIPKLNAFSETELEGVLKLSKIVQYDPGELIIEEGYFDNRIYFLVSGTVRIVKHDEDLSTLSRAVDVFGEMGVIDGSPRSASVYAIDESVCLVTDASHIDRLSGNDRLSFCYILYRIFAEILANRLRVTSEELVAAKEEIKRLKQKWNRHDS